MAHLIFSRQIRVERPGILVVRDIILARKNPLQNQIWRRVRIWVNLGGTIDRSQEILKIWIREFKYDNHF